MTDAELNEIFRAIKGRRTLSWKTIEKLAIEVRELRKPKPAVKPANVPSKPASPQVEKYFQDLAVSMRRKQDLDTLDAFLFGRQQFTFNIDPTKDFVDKTKVTLLPKSK